MSDERGRVFSPGSMEWPERLREFAEADLTPRRAEMRRLADSARTMVHTLVNNRTRGRPRRGRGQPRGVGGEADRAPQQLDLRGVRRGGEQWRPTRLLRPQPDDRAGEPTGAPDRAARRRRTHGGPGRVGPAYEGPPGCVHGGFIAAAFDEVLGSTQSLSGSPGMTGPTDRPLPEADAARHRPPVRRRARSGRGPEDLHGGPSLLRRPADGRGRRSLHLDRLRALREPQGAAGGRSERIAAVVLTSSGGVSSQSTPSSSSANRAARIGPSPGIASRAARSTGRAAAMARRTRSGSSASGSVRARRAARVRQSRSASFVRSDSLSP